MSAKKKRSPKSASKETPASLFQKVAVEIEDTSSESEMEDVTETVRQPAVKSGGKGKKGKDAEKTVKKTASEKKKAKALEADVQEKTDDMGSLYGDFFSQE